MYRRLKWCNSNFKTCSVHSRCLFLTVPYANWLSTQLLKGLDLSNIAMITANCILLFQPVLIAFTVDCKALDRQDGLFKAVVLESVNLFLYCGHSPLPICGQIYFCVGDVNSAKNNNNKNMDQTFLKLSATYIKICGDCGNILLCVALALFLCTVIPFQSTYSILMVIQV